MAKKLSENEVLLRNLTKAKTAEIRLRHSLAADREVLATMPDLEKDFWRAVQLGVQREFAAGEVNASFFGEGPTVDLTGPAALVEGDDEV